ncbi:MAG: hypothetical protein A2016_04500 [Elusimicrobia bacterium GWF2_62_30]|nr:MAG: hypothetical protein A2016_04500 [Elusimicrobia bacterium GWF2_62_30]
MSSSRVFATKTLFLGDNPVISRLVADLQSHKYNRFRLTTPEALGRWKKKSVVAQALAGGDTPKLSDIIDLLVVDAEPVLLNKEHQEIIAAAMDEAIPIWTHVDFYEDLYKKVPLYVVRNPNWLFTHVLHRRNEAYVFFKRILDLGGAGALTLVMLPFLPFVALAIKLTDSGPVFYAQERFGYLSKNFCMWKFRTMRVDADKQGYVWNAGKADPRITAIGRLLRKFRIDEFPQLWNILKGEMSLVGPRPTWVGEKQINDIPEYHMRRMVTPGLTGWAQINSSATDNEDDTKEKLSYDLYYVKNLSFALDISILLKTVRRVLESDHAIRQKRRAAAKAVDCQPLETLQDN